MEEKKVQKIVIPEGTFHTEAKCVTCVYANWRDTRGKEVWCAVDNSYDYRYYCNRYVRR